MPMSNPKHNTEKILVIKLGALGDFIQACGPMAAIRVHHPHAQITLLTTMAFKPFADKMPFIDKVWIDEKPGWGDVKTWLKFRKSINKENFSRVYDLQNSDRSCFYFYLMNRPKPEWVGTAFGASHRNTSNERTKGHAFDGHVQTLGMAGIHNVKIDTLTWLDEDVSHFPLKDSYVLIVPGSSPEHPHKRWPASSYAKLCTLLTRMGYQCVILGTKAEKDVAESILKSCPEALNLCGQTSLGQISNLARDAAGAIGNDTGPMHLIAATSCPVLALFSGKSSIAKHRPMGLDVEVLQETQLENLEIQKVINSFRPREEPAGHSATMH